MESNKTIKILKGCGWGVLAIVLLFTIVMAIASPVAKHMINTKGPEWIGREMHVDRVIINPFTGGVSLKGFECKEQNGETNFVTFDKLYVRVAYPQLLFKRVKVREIEMDGFNGQILKSNDRFNFTDIIEHLSKDSTEKDDEPSKWVIILDDIQIRNSAIHYRDVVNDKQWKLQDISLHIPGLYFDNKTTNAGIEFGLTTGGRVGIDADYNMESGEYKVDLRMNDVHSDALLPIVQDYLNVKSLGAKMEGQLHVNGNMDDIENIHFDGNLSMSGLNMRTQQNEKVVGFDELKIGISKGDLKKQEVILDEFTMKGLTGTYSVTTEGSTVSQLLKSNDAPVQEEPSTGMLRLEADESEDAVVSKPRVIMAKKLSISGHDLVYKDQSMTYPWEYVIKQLTISGNNVATNGRNAITVDATLMSDATLKADFTGGLDFAKYDTKLDLKLRGVHIEDFDALCRNYTGYPIEGGILIIDSKMDVTSGQLKGTNRIEIDHPRIGKRERGTKAPYKNIPVRAGFKTLTSAKDMIIVDVPVSGDATNPKFNFKKVISRALLKVFFGPLMGLNDREKSITAEELKEMQELLGEDESLRDDAMLEVPADVTVSAGDSVSLTEIGE